MTLVGMLNFDEDALFCDIAETYGIVGFKGLSVLELATLSFGLRDNSRIKMKLSDSPVDLNTILMASAVDQLNFLSWCKTRDAEKGRNRPKSVVQSLLKTQYKKESDFEVYATPEEFFEARKKLLLRGEKNE